MTKTMTDQTKENRILCIVGPTAVGKTALAVSAAKRLNGEIISCDSMQIYDGLMIGTARPSEEETEGVPYHLIGFADPRTPFSCMDYAEQAIPVVEDIRRRGCLPIVCGGTGLYLDALLRPRAAVPETDPGLRSQLEEQVSRRGIDAVYSRLREVDPESCRTIHPNNTRRVIRALEIYLATGIPKSVWDSRSQSQPDRYASCLIGLSCLDRSVLQRRIDLRVDRMMEQGLLDEVRQLRTRGLLPPGSTAAQAIGYKELISFLDGNGTLDDAVEQIRVSTRQYAKRQLTWFRRYPDIHWIYPDSREISGDPEILLEQVLAVWNRPV